MSSVSTNNHFFYRKLHSLLGLFPIGFFLLEHLITNSFAILSPERFDRAVVFLQNIPYLIALEIIFIALPLTIHGLYGLYIVYLAKNNLFSYSYARNWMFYLQRLSAVITLVFVIIHVWQLKLVHSLTGLSINFITMHNLLSDPLWLTFYIIGLLAACFHFANGLWNFTVSWGIAVGEQVQTFIWRLCMLLFIFSSLIGLTAIWAFIQ